ELNAFIPLSSTTRNNTESWLILFLVSVTCFSNFLFKSLASFSLLNILPIVDVWDFIELK
ncbi:hypothetical protein Q604_UNBc4C00248G0001, partial [human gut metagenome]